MTRKLIAIAAIASLASLAAFASRGNGGAVRGAAARAGMMAAGASVDENSYTEGMIIQFDCQSGFTTSSWTDLRQNFSVPMSGVSVASDGGIYFNGSWGGYTASFPNFYSASIVTVEIVCKIPTSARNNIVIFNCSNAYNIQFSIYDDGYLEVGKGYPGNTRKFATYSTFGVARTYSVSFSNTDSLHYIDGVSTAYLGSSSHMDGSGFCIGRLAGSSDRNFYGEIYSIRIYPRLLTDAEIEYNHTVDNRRFNLP